MIGQFTTSMRHIHQYCAQDVGILLIQIGKLSLKSTCDSIKSYHWICNLLNYKVHRIWFAKRCSDYHGSTDIKITINQN